MNKTHFGWKEIFLLTLLLGGVFLTIDQFWQGSPVTPLLSLCWLIGIAVRRGPGLVVVAGILLLLFVLASLRAQSIDRVIIRTLSFIVGGGMTALYAASRERTLRLIEHFQLVINRIPAAVATVDALGCITSASAELKELVGPDYTPLEGHSFSDVLLGQYPPGEAMRYYINSFQQSGVREETFCLRGKGQLPIPGRVICSGEGQDRVLIAVIYAMRSTSKTHHEEECMA